MKRKKVFITDIYSLNSGDIAIAMSIIESLQLEYKEIDLAVESSHPRFLSQYPEFDDCRIFPRIFDIENIFQKRFGSDDLYKGVSVYGKIQAIFFGFYDSIAFLIWAFISWIGMDCLWIIRKSRREQACFMREVDMVISSGGGFLSTHYHYEFRLYLYFLVLLLQKPFYIFAQSIGPFDSCISRVCIPAFLNRVSCVTVREPYTKRFLTSFKGLSDVMCTADIAFLLEKGDNKNLPFNPREYVTICIRDPQKGSVREKYKKIMLGVIEHTTHKKLSVCLVSHTTADDVLCEEIYYEYRQIDPTCAIKVYLFGVHPKELKALYGESAYLISGRMHAIIFGLTSGTPFIAISYEEKFIGLMEQLNLGMFKVFVLLNVKNISLEKLLLSIDVIEKEHSYFTELIERQVEKLTCASRQNILFVQDMIKK
ncbi:MAG: polysaccharide pyruvyl transferase family protein [Candidatus Pacebacteria bacterium]|nr:polysaccharide pyruvyl transferase family protein [Candidatus Paceibacterota bacterium]